MAVASANSRFTAYIVAVQTADRADFGVLARQGAKPVHVGAGRGIAQTGFEFVQAQREAFELLA